MPNLLPILILTTIWCGSFAIAALPFVFAENGHPVGKILGLAATPLLFVVAFPVIAGLLSMPARKGIQKGKFPREAFHPVYLLRRIYGACWTQVYYCKPVYAVVLAIPVLRKLVFRLFGYKGTTDFIVYPDTWIRDLPLLDIGANTYLSNRATIGTNMCMSDGSILVDRVQIDENGLVGHLSLVGPGAKIGTHAEIGVNCAIGIRSVIKENSSIKVSCMVNHGAVIGSSAEIGTRSYVGLRAEVGSKVRIPAGANIPAGALILTQNDAEKYFSSETKMLNDHREMVAEVVQQMYSNGQT